MGDMKFIKFLEKNYTKAKFFLPFYKSNNDPFVHRSNLFSYKIFMKFFIGGLFSNIPKWTKICISIAKCHDRHSDRHR